MACVPATQASDIALVLDRSSSMQSDGKFVAARQAIRQFAAEAKAPPDQLALVTFADVAGLNQPLDSDKLAFERALGAVLTGSGTRIDLGLAVARAELMGARHRPGNARVIVLLSDGVQAPGQEGLVDSEADAAKASGILVFTVALGADADTALLRRVATSPTHAYIAPTAADLAAIYARIAVAIPCPPTRTPEPSVPSRTPGPASSTPTGPEPTRTGTVEILPTAPGSRTPSAPAPLPAYLPFVAKLNR
jgi:hypothetical protein